MKAGLSICFGLSLVALTVSGIGAADAQSAGAAQPTQQYKNSTPIPPGVAIPDSVETRLGTLKFFDGFPDDASVAKLYDNLDFQRAVQAYLLGLAPVNQLANRKGIAALGPINATVPIFEDRMDSKSLFLTPNNNTPYTWFWLDLRDGPLVLEAPPKVLGLINDMWYHFVTDIGLVGPDKGKGGKYLILPPGYKGKVPSGYFVVRSATYSVWVPWRSFLVDGDPKPGVDLVEKHTRIYRLKDAANPPPAEVRACVRQGVQHARAGGLHLLGRTSTKSCRRSRRTRSIPLRSGCTRRSAFRRASPLHPMRA